MGVKIIKARNAPPAADLAPEKKKLRVAAYARVSTDLEEQEGSYEAQIAHYTSLIQNNPDWDFAGMFADEGVSGTQAKKRPEFLRMIAACENREIDMVITKSISRWARNTLDSLTYIRKLKDLNIPVIFEKESINTMDASGELLLTIMASIAQQESQSISQNTRMGIHYGFQEGKGRLNTTRFLGLEVGSKPGEYVINPEQADIARRIFREFLEGYSPGMIAKHLNNEAIPTACEGGTWFASTVARVLENEKYAGDMLLQKYYVPNFLDHKSVKNTGQLPQYYVENHHDPIIPKEVYFQTQGELMRRGNLKNDPNKIRFGSTQALIRRLICPICGRTLKKVQNGDRIEWRCRYQSREVKTTRGSGKSPCGCRFVPEDDAKQAIVDAFNLLPEFKDELLRKQGEVRTGELKRIDSLMEQSIALETRLEERKVQADADGNTAEIEFLELEIARCRVERNDLILERAEYAGQELQIRFLLELLDDMEGKEIPPADDSPACRDYEDFFRRTRHKVNEEVLDGDVVTRFDNDLVIRYVDKVIIEPNGYEVYFKAGIVITV